MLIALLSDVHGNAAALREVLKRIQELGPDHLFSLGDLVGRGPEPSVVVRMLGQRGVRNLRGNWDEWVFGAEGWDERPKRRAWVEAARAMMSKHAISSLGRAPRTRRFVLDGVRVLLAHGSPRNPVELLTPDLSEERMAEAIGGARADVVVVGHSHRGFVRQIGPTLVVNTGTVGYSFDGDPRATFALLHTGRPPHAELIRVPYELDKTVRAMTRAVARRHVTPEAGYRYFRALLGEGPEPLAPIHRDDRGAELLVKLFAKRIRAVYRGPRGDRLVASEDAIHDARVATRRLREALVLASPLLERSDCDRAIERVLTFGRVLGRRRTADVLRLAVENLAVDRSAGDEEAYVSRLKDLLDVRRRRSGATILDEYPAERLIEQGLATLALAMRPTSSEISLDTLAQTALEPRIRGVERFVSALDDSRDSERHHRLRIQFRRLRFALEPLTDPFSEASLESALDELKEIQEALGSLNDIHELWTFVASARASRRGTLAAAVNLSNLIWDHRQALFEKAKDTLDARARPLLEQLRDALHVPKV